MARQEWLAKVTDELRGLFAAKGYTVPHQVRASIGFASAGIRSRVIGECWSPVASSDQHAEIFLVPTMADPVVIVATLAHELVHATVGNAAKHGKVFKACALAIGLTGKMTATTAGADLQAWIAAMLARVGDYPAGNLQALSNGKKKQTTRMVKAVCVACGYTVRLSRKWIEDVGAPHCPADGGMTIDGDD